MTTVTTIPSDMPATSVTTVPEGELEVLLHDLAEEAVDQRWSEDGERAGDLVLSATVALRDGNLQSALSLALRAGRLLRSSLVLDITA